MLKRSPTLENLKSYLEKKEDPLAITPPTPAPPASTPRADPPYRAYMWTTTGGSRVKAKVPVNVRNDEKGNPRIIAFEPIVAIPARDKPFSSEQDTLLNELLGQPISYKSYIR